MRSTLAITATCLLVAEFAVIGGDARWLAALGRTVLQTSGVPDGIPYASSPSSGWPNVLVLAELVFHAAHSLAQDRGLLALHGAAVAVGLLVLGADARRGGASDSAVAVTVCLVVLGAATSLFIVRLQLFSLLLLPVLVALLRDDHRRISHRVWLVVPLLALWSNLHGAVLIGTAVTGSYLLLSRLSRRPRSTVAIGLAAVASLCATPAAWDTPSYYLGVLHNESARQNIGLWERLSLTSPFDVALLVVAVVFLVALSRARPPLWEWVAYAGLAVMTADAVRTGVWLLLAAAPVVAVGLTRQRAAVPSGGGPRAALVGVPVLVLLLATLRGPVVDEADRHLLDLAIASAAGSAVAADGVAAEQVAVAGGCLWLANPLDAFGQQEQRRYLTWLESGRVALLPAGTRAVVVTPGSPAAAALAGASGFALVRQTENLALFRSGDADGPTRDTCQSQMLTSRHDRPDR